MDLLNALMANDYTHEEAVEEITYMKKRVRLGENPEEMLYEIGLEPDYVFDLID